MWRESRRLPEDIGVVDVVKQARQRGIAAGGWRGRLPSLVPTGEGLQDVDIAQEHQFN